MCRAPDLTTMKNLAAAACALAGFVLLHEGGHALLGAAWNETVGFRTHFWGLAGFEVLFRTPVEEREGLRWAVISGGPNVVTVWAGYGLYAVRARVRGPWRPGSRFGRTVGYWATMFLLLLDPVNLALGPFLYGGDAYGVAVGLAVPVGVVQGVALMVLLVNRELVVRRLLPEWGIETRHPLLRPLPGRRGGDQAPALRDRSPLRTPAAGVGMARKNPVLALAGTLSLTVAAFQAVISLSPEQSLYYGAPPELAAHPSLLAAAGIGAAMVFLVFGLYGLSGARFLRPLPLLRPALVGIAVIYLIRGLAVIPAVLVRLQSPEATGSSPELASASAALVIGIAYAAGTAAGWNELGKAVVRRRPVA
jgi:hypothetical protein